MINFVSYIVLETFALVFYMCVITVYILVFIDKWAIYIYTSQVWWYLVHQDNIN